MKLKDRLKNIDFSIVAIPVVIVVILFLLFMLAPMQSTAILNSVRGFLGNELGAYYLVIGLGIFMLTIIMAFSKYGRIKLGKSDKPEFSDFKWGAMIFTSTLAADILFYSMSEWAMYANETHVSDMGTIQDWASTYPLFPYRTHAFR